MAMPFLKLLVSYFVLLGSFNFASCEVDTPTYYDHNCTIHNNFTSNSPYHYNLNDLLVSLYSKATGIETTDEFYNNTVPTTSINDANPDTVYGEYMCRGDVPIQVCQDCVQDAANRISSECPNSKEAIIWYDECFLRYSNRYFFSNLQQIPTVGSKLAVPGAGAPITTCTLNKSTPCGIPSHLGFRNQTDMGYTRLNNSNADPNAYGVLNKTLNDAVVEAAKSGSAGTKKFATKEANLSSNWGSLYTLVQCTSDLSTQSCSQCLYDMMELIPTDYIAPSGRIMNPSCYLRFGVDRFYYKGKQPPSTAQGTVTTFFSFPCL